MTGAGWCTPSRKSLRQTRGSRPPNTQKRSRLLRSAIVSIYCFVPCMSVYWMVKLHLMARMSSANNENLFQRSQNSKKEIIDFIPPAAGTSIDHLHTSGAESRPFHRHRNYPQSIPKVRRHSFFPDARSVSNGTFDFATLLDPRDPILIPGKGWDVSPVVLEKYKLLFFTTPKVGTTVFKQLFRRMMGYPDWMLEQEPNLPHSPQHNGLLYLYDCSPELQAEIFNPAFNWTRAIFVRDPLERLLSAYLDKAVRHKAIYVKRHCCSITESPQRNPKLQQDLEDSKRQVEAENQRKQEDLLAGSQDRRGGGRFSRRRLAEVSMRALNLLHSESAVAAARKATIRGGGTNLGPPSVPQGQAIPAICANFTVEDDPNLSFETFVKDILPQCSIDPHWAVQSTKLSSTALWASINFVGHFANLQDDTEKLLKRVGAWDQFGRTDWPPGGPIFASNMARHKTDAHYTWNQHYTSQGLIDFAMAHYEEDYGNSYLQLNGSFEVSK